MTKHTTEQLEPCPFCKSSTRINTVKKRIGKACPHIYEASQVKCKKQSCGMSGPLIKGEGSRARALKSWNASRKREAEKDEQIAALVDVWKWMQYQMCEGFCKDLPANDTYEKGMDLDCAVCRLRAAHAAVKAATP